MAIVDEYIEKYPDGWKKLVEDFNKIYDTMNTSISGPPNIPSQISGTIQQNNPLNYQYNHITIGKNPIDDKFHVYINTGDFSKSISKSDDLPNAIYEFLKLLYDITLIKDVNDNIIGLDLKRKS